MTFSDPQRKKPNKRLTSKVFIERYRQILKPGGFVHLKTDSDILFEFTEQEIKTNNYPSEIVSWDIYQDLDNLQTEEEKQILQIKTHYEKLFSAKGSTIKYAKFKIS